jgi:hypothetical protein
MKSHPTMPMDRRPAPRRGCPAQNSKRLLVSGAVWHSILSALTDASNTKSSGTASTDVFPAGVPRARKKGRLDASCSGARSTIVFSNIERTGTRSALVSWYDSTFGHYTEQRWVLGVSRINGVCALTAQRISPGDAVFRPAIQHSIKPCNAGTLILERSLDEADVVPRVAEKRWQLVSHQATHNETAPMNQRRNAYA